MSRPAEPERKDPHIGQSNPAESLWGEKKPYVGPPEDGQPRKGASSDEPALAPKIMGEPKKR